MRKLIFKDLTVGDKFTTPCGVPYIKASSRTARAGEGHPREGRPFYFQQTEAIRHAPTETSNQHQA